MEFRCRKHKKFSSKFHQKTDAEFYENLMKNCEKLMQKLRTAEWRLQNEIFFDSDRIFVDFGCPGGARIRTKPEKSMPEKSEKNEAKQAKGL